MKSKWFSMKVMASFCLQCKHMFKRIDAIEMSISSRTIVQKIYKHSVIINTIPSCLSFRRWDSFYMQFHSACNSSNQKINLLSQPELLLQLVPHWVWLIHFLRSVVGVINWYCNIIILMTGSESIQYHSFRMELTFQVLVKIWMKHPSQDVELHSHTTAVNSNKIFKVCRDARFKSGFVLKILCTAILSMDKFKMKYIERDCKNKKLNKSSKTRHLL